MNNALRAISVILQLLGILYIGEVLFDFRLIPMDKESPRATESGIRDIAAKTGTEKFSGRGYPDLEQAEFNTAVLTSMNIEFEYGFYDDIHSVSWSKQEEAIEKEIEARVGQFQFVRDICPGLPIPKPNEPSKEKLSCSSQSPDWYVPPNKPGQAQ